MNQLTGKLGWRERKLLFSGYFRLFSSFSTLDSYFNTILKDSRKETKKRDVLDENNLSLTTKTLLKESNEQKETFLKNIYGLLSNHKSISFNHTKFLLSLYQQNTAFRDIATTIVKADLTRLLKSTSSRSFVTKHMDMISNTPELLEIMTHFHKICSKSNFDFYLVFEKGWGTDFLLWMHQNGNNEVKLLVKQIFLDHLFKFFEQHMHKALFLALLPQRVERDEEILKAFISRIGYLFNPNCNTHDFYIDRLSAGLDLSTSVALFQKVDAKARQIKRSPFTSSSAVVRLMNDLLQHTNGNILPHMAPGVSAVLEDIVKGSRVTKKFLRDFLYRLTTADSSIMDPILKEEICSKMIELLHEEDNILALNKVIYCSDIYLDLINVGQEAKFPFDKLAKSFISIDPRTFDSQRFANVLISIIDNISDEQVIYQLLVRTFKDWPVEKIASVTPNIYCHALRAENPVLRNLLLKVLKDEFDFILDNFEVLVKGKSSSFIIEALTDVENLSEEQRGKLGTIVENLANEAFSTTASSYAILSLLQKPDFFERNSCLDIVHKLCLPQNVSKILDYPHLATCYSRILTENIPMLKETVTELSQFVFNNYGSIFPMDDAIQERQKVKQYDKQRYQRNKNTETEWKKNDFARLRFLGLMLINSSLLQNTNFLPILESISTSEKLYPLFFNRGSAGSSAFNTICVPREEDLKNDSALESVFFKSYLNSMKVLKDWLCNISTPEVVRKRCLETLKRTVRSQPHMVVDRVLRLFSEEEVINGDDIIQEAFVKIYYKSTWAVKNEFKELATSLDCFEEQGPITT